MIQLNANELAIFAAAAQAIQDETGGQFGYSDEMKLPAGIAKKQVSGYMSSLVKKGLLTVDEEFGQVQVGQNFLEAAIQYQVGVGQSFETYNGQWLTVPGLPTAVSDELADTLQKIEDNDMGEMTPPMSEQDPEELVEVQADRFNMKLLSAKKNVEPPVEVPLKGKPSIRQNAYGNWYGYRGARKVEHFFNDDQGSQEDHAREWLAQQQAAIVPVPAKKQGIKLASYRQRLSDAGISVTVYPAVEGEFVGFWSVEWSDRQDEKLSISVTSPSIDAGLLSVNRRYCRSKAIEAAFLNRAKSEGVTVIV